MSRSCETAALKAQVSAAWRGQGRAEAGQVTGCRHSVPNCVPGNPFSVGHVSYLTANPTTILVSSGVAHPALNGTEKMPKVTVFKIKCFDAFVGEERILRCMATRSGARLLGDGFEIIEGTAIEVDASQLERGEPWTGVGFHAPGSAQAAGSVNIR